MDYLAIWTRQTAESNGGFFSSSSSGCRAVPFAEDSASSLTIGKFSKYARDIAVRLLLTGEPRLSAHDGYNYYATTEGTDVVFVLAMKSGGDGGGGRPGSGFGSGDSSVIDPYAIWRQVREAFHGARGSRDAIVAADGTPRPVTAASANKTRKELSDIRTRATENHLQAVKAKVASMRSAAQQTIGLLAARGAAVEDYTLTTTEYDRVATDYERNSQAISSQRRKRMILIAAGVVVLLLLVAFIIMLLVCSRGGGVNFSGCFGGGDAPAPAIPLPPFLQRVRRLRRS